jgi:putative ABC transport system ATP-binding protein
MLLQVKKILPVYFKEEQKNNSETWGNDLSFSNGDWIKIVAPSGSGKTSLIHFLYGLRQDYTGQIIYDGTDMKKFSLEDLSRIRKNHFSIVFQDMRLFAEQTVWENLEIKRQLNPFHKPEMINEMCERLGIAHKIKSICKQCSYGEQQRVSIIRALMQPFDILLLDEPFSHLDNANAEKAMELIAEETKKRNAGILYADLERNEFFPYTRLYHL